MCVRYRNTLHALVSKVSQNPRFQFPFSPTSAEYGPLKTSSHRVPPKSYPKQEQAAKCLREKVQKVLEGDSLPLDEELSGDIQKMISQHKVIEKDDFRRIFWEQLVL